jgi:transcriptional regulator GlxA family with amidase domain
MATARVKAGERTCVGENAAHNQGPFVYSGRSDAPLGRPGPAGAKLAPWQVRVALEALGAEISGSVAIPLIAARCGLSFSHFVRAFRNTVGVAPYDWFLERKVELAQSLLASSELPLAQIALECGFVDQSHFSKTFVRRAGQTPLQWRRAAKLLEKSGPR